MAEDSSSESSASPRAKAPAPRGEFEMRMPARMFDALAAAAAGIRLRPRRPWAAEAVPLRVGDVQRDERAQIVEVLDTFGADRRAGARREPDQRLQQRLARAVGVRAVDQRAVELEDVGRDPDHLLQARVARSGVVEGDQRTTPAQLGERGLQLALGAEHLVLGEFDHDPRQVLRERALDRRGQQRARREVEREERAVGTVRDLERGPHGERFELVPETDPVRLREPLVRAAARLDVDAGEGLIAAGAARGELHDGLDDDLDRARAARQQLRDLVALLGFRADRAALVAHGPAPAGTLGEVQGRVGVLEQDGGLVPVDGARGDTRGRRERPATDGQLRDRRAGALGAVLGGLRVGTRQDDHELLAAHPADDVVGAHDRAQPLRAGPEHPVALGVAERVVDDLEVVEVEQHDGHRVPLVQ